jgi:crotonobetainyl-CoA:carnitine CoA-transferase CaiB-like acyl-CoA transferase
MGTRHPTIAPYGDLFACADGQMVLLAVGTERQFKQLCQCLDMNDLPENPLFSNNQARVQNREGLNEILAEAISKCPLDEWIPFFKSQGVPAARIRDMKAVFDLPEARAMVLEETTASGQPTQRMKTVAFKIT